MVDDPVDCVDEFVDVEGCAIASLHVCVHVIAVLLPEGVDISPYDLDQLAELVP